MKKEGELEILRRNKRNIGIFIFIVYTIVFIGIGYSLYSFLNLEENKIILGNYRYIFITFFELGIFGSWLSIILRKRQEIKNGEVEK